MFAVLKRLALTMGLAGMGAVPVWAEGPVVVELYTSQGCSSCPPADALLEDLAGRADVLALALHVDYWDYIGWVDTHGDAAHTARQNAYARAAGHARIYTPQFVIGGVDHVVGAKPMDVADLIMDHRNTETGVSVLVTRAEQRVQIRGQADSHFAQAVDVQLVRYRPLDVVLIRRGENAGRQIRYVNIVTDWQNLGRWDGRSDLDLSLSAPTGDRLAVIVQASGQGKILATAIAETRP